MRKYGKFTGAVLIIMLLLGANTGVLEAVTFDSQTTDGSNTQAPAPKVVGNSKTGKSSDGALLYSLDAPQSQKQRLADSIKFLHLAGAQASLAVGNLKALDGQTLPDNEILARLTHAEESLAVLERAAKRLNDNVELVKMACLEDPALKEEIMAMLEGLFAAPAYAFTGDPAADSYIGQEIQGIGRAAKSSFNSFMNTLSSAATSIGNAASYVKNAIGTGIGKVTGAIGSVHTKIGNVVGQENWKNIMAGTKFTCTIVGGTVALIVAAPVSTAGAVGAVVVWTAANIGAAVSLANDLGDGKDPGGIDNAMTRINQGTAIIGIVGGGSPGEVFVNVLGVSGNEIIGTTPGEEMSPAQVAEFLGTSEGKEYLKNLAALKEYKKPDAPQTGGGGGGGDCGSH
ncbi:MAG: hypothetical protein Q7I97_03780 [Thermovirgaceae bacterium]|nr:hypothetical protein [Thermovirgaceae bacterium]